MAAHRYWRIVSYKSNTVVYEFCVLAEVELRASPGGANQCVGGTVSASTSRGSNPPSYALDGNASTDWITLDGNQHPHWWQYDFGAGNAKDIVEVYLRASGAWPEMAPQHFSVLYSDDGATWACASAYIGQVYTAGEAKTFSIAPTVPTYPRFVFGESNPNAPLGSTLGWAPDYAGGCKYTLASPDTVKALRVHFQNGEPTARVKAAIYTHDPANGAGGGPGALLAQSAEVVGVYPDKITEFTLTAPVALPAGDYWLCIIGGTATLPVGVVPAGAGAGTYIDPQAYSSGFTDPFGSTSSWWGSNLKIAAFGDASSVTSVTPATGSPLGGTNVTIAGSGFATAGSPGRLAGGPDDANGAAFVYVAKAVARHTLSTPATVSSVFVRLGTSYGVTEFRAIVYADDGTGRPGALLGQSAVQPWGTEGSLLEVPLTSTLSLPAGNYYVGIHAPGYVGVKSSVNLSPDTGFTARRWRDSADTFSDGPSATWGTPDDFVDNGSPDAWLGGTGLSVGAGAHRYWRVYVTAAWASYVDFSLVQMRTAPGGTDYAEQAVQANQAAALESGHLGTGNAYKAFDGSSDASGVTYWLSNATMPQWVGVDLGTARAIAEVKLRNVNAYPSESPKDFKIQWSNDGLAWTDAASFTGEAAWSAGETRTYAVQQAPSVKFGGIAATNVALVNADTITCTTPAHAAGAVDVSVDAVTKAGGFTYVWTLTITPTHGPTSGGTRVRVVRS